MAISLGMYPTFSGPNPYVAYINPKSHHLECPHRGLKSQHGCAIFIAQAADGSIQGPTSVPRALEKRMANLCHLMGKCWWTLPLHLWYMFLNICFYDRKLCKTKTKNTYTSCWSGVQHPFEYMQKIGASSYDLQSGTHIYIYILSPLSAVMVTLKQWQLLIFGRLHGFPFKPPNKILKCGNNQTLIFVLHLFSQNRFLRVFHHKGKSSVQLYLKQMSTAAKSKSWNGAILDQHPRISNKTSSNRGHGYSLSLSLSPSSSPSQWVNKFSRAKGLL